MIKNKIDRERELSNAITRAYENKDNYSENDPTMNTFGELYLEHYQYHLQDSISVCARQKEQIQALGPVFFDYSCDLKSMLTWSFENDEWIICCHRRSNIEACIMLFADTLDPECLDLDPECFGLDDAMKSKGEVEGGCLEEGELPQNTPKTHWWWFI